MNPAELNLATMAKELSSPDAAREFIESLLWPNGPVCHHCKGANATLLKSKPGTKNPVRNGLYKCRNCRGKFTVTMGTIFEASHIKLNVWLQAAFLICSAKKAISAHQIHRSLGVTYKTAWFLCHRIRYAMAAAPALAEKFAGIVQADETYVGGKWTRKAGDSILDNKYKNKTAVVSLIETSTGNKRSFVMPYVTANNLGAAIAMTVKEDAEMHTDEHAMYPKAVAGRKHRTVVHSKKEYARMDDDGVVVHTNYCESSFSLLKRGVFGSFHHVSRKHLHRYGHEFDFRWNHRKISDGERTVAGLRQVVGKRLTYRWPNNGKAAALVA